MKLTRWMSYSGVFCLLLALTAWGVTSEVSARTLCPPGKEYIGSLAGGICKPCRIGYYKSKSGNHKCKPCGRGTYAAKTGQRFCTKCMKGMFTNARGSKHCYMCPKGQTTSRPEATNRGMCKACPKGTYLKYKANSQGFVCVSCPAGKINPQTGGYHISHCKVCPPGKGTVGHSRVKCYTCPYHFYSSGGVCKPCPDHYYTTVKGARSSSQCKRCSPANHYRTPNKPQCQARKVWN